MTHPLLLHFRAASSSLAASLVALEARAMEAVADAVAGNREARDVGIPSQTYGRRHALGGHGDPTAVQALGAWAPGGPNPYAALLGDLMRQLDQAAQFAPGAPGMDPLTRIRRAVPAMRVEVVEKTTQALTHLDGYARRELLMPPALLADARLPECPACRCVSLYWQTAAPEAEWTAVCRLGCLCSGEGCPCGMPVRVEGVGHIWDRSAPLVESALTSDTRPPGPTTDTTQPAEAA